MVLGIVKRDLRRNRLVTAVLFLFVMLSALLASASTGLVVTLTGSLNALFTRAKTPHFVQMHAGALDKELVAAWAQSQPMVESHQIVEMLNIDGSKIRLGKDAESQASTVMDIGFVIQNREFDFLLGGRNEILKVSPGEIALPVYYLRQGTVKVGDRVGIGHGDFEKVFKVAAFHRDSQMNPALVHSKRFLVHEEDFGILKANLGETECLIEFRLRNPEDLDVFSREYRSANLPAEGPAVDHNLFKVLNGFSDGLVAVVVMLACLLLIAISLLCLRFSLLSAVEEDYREIGVMKALGFGKRVIKKIYLVKYRLMTGLAVLSGYGLSLAVGRLFAGDMLLNLGEAPEGLSRYLVPLCAAGAVYWVIMLSCRFILRRFDGISASAALREGNLGGAGPVRKLLSLSKSWFLGVNALLGIKDLLGRAKTYLPVFLVFAIAVFIVVVPVNFLTTLRSPSFITYMGIGQSDVRIDIGRTERMTERFSSILTYLGKDADVLRFSPFVTCRYKVETEDGAMEDLSVETGDFSVFPLEYLEGRAPLGEGEIALSHLNALDLGKRVGDSLRLTAGNMKREIVVTGIYQDITNGGRTAKAVLPGENDLALWYVIGLDLRPGADVRKKLEEYEKAFYPAKVTDLEGYLSQTLGNTIWGLALVTLFVVLIALAVSLLITFLFLKMDLSKDRSRIAIMKSIGFSSRHIRTQYRVRMLVLLVSGIVAGTVFADILGQRMISGLLSLVGASRIEFVVDPVAAYMLCPLVLIAAVASATALGLGPVKRVGLAELNLE